MPNPAHAAKHIATSIAVSGRLQTRMCSPLKHAISLLHLFTPHSTCWAACTDMSGRKTRPAGVTGAWWDLCGPVSRNPHSLGMSPCCAIADCGWQRHRVKHNWCLLQLGTAWSEFDTRLCSHNCLKNVSHPAALKFGFHTNEGHSSSPVVKTKYTKSRLVTSCCHAVMEN